MKFKIREQHIRHYYTPKQNKQKTRINLNSHYHQSQLSSMFIKQLIMLFIGPDPFAFMIINHPFNIRPYYFMIFTHFVIRPYYFIIFAYYYFIVFEILLSFIKFTNSIIGILIIITSRITISSLLIMVIIGNSLFINWIFFIKI